MTKGEAVLLATGSGGTTQYGYDLPENINNFSLVLLCQRDNDTSGGGYDRMWASTLVPVSVFKTMNSTQKSLECSIGSTNDVACYYVNDNRVMMRGQTGFRPVLYGIR